MSISERIHAASRRFEMGIGGINPDIERQVREFRGDPRSTGYDSACIEREVLAEIFLTEDYRVEIRAPKNN